jgi:hypothetical protein
LGGWLGVEVGEKREERRRRRNEIKKTKKINVG